MRLHKSSPAIKARVNALRSDVSRDRRGSELKRQTGETHLCVRSPVCVSETAACFLRRKSTVRL